MSLSTALNVATSGLRATSIQSDLVARNIANASTEGYTRKSAELLTRNGAVHVNAITREVDSLLDRLDRTSISENARAETVASGLRTYTDMLGQPDSETSPAAAIGQLYTSIITLSGTPGSSAAQLGVLEAANVVTGQLNSLATTVNELDREVDLNIRYDVADMNERLIRVGQINARLMQSGSLGAEGVELQDELGRILDEVSGFMDVQVTTYADGAVNIYTAGGTELVQGKRIATISYDAARGELRANDIEITPAKGDARGFTAGSLAGLFELKRHVIPQLNGDLDSYAGMLIDRFTAGDPTLAAGESGLFVDSANSASVTGITGLAARIRVNPLADPAQGGISRRISEGFGTANPIETGSLEVVQKLMSTIDHRAEGETPYGARLSLSDYAGAMVAGQQQMRVAAERTSEAARVSGATIAASRENLQGVNVDDELQKLLVIEQSFAANAKVLTSVQTMLDTLLHAV